MQTSKLNLMLPVV